MLAMDAHRHQYAVTWGAPELRAALGAKIGRYTGVPVDADRELVVTCGATTGPKLEADLRLVFFKSLSILGSTMGSLGALHRLTGLVGRGVIDPVIDRVLPLEKTAEGHAALEARATFGKVVIIPGA